MTIRKWLALFFPVVLVLTGCANSRFKQNTNVTRVSDGVVVRLAQEEAGDPRLMKVEVCDHGILRVVATPGPKFSTKPSLIVPNSDGPVVPFSVQQKGETVQIATGDVTAKVSAKTGEVAFYDAGGGLILRERTGGGKSIVAADVMGEQTFHVRQVFASPDDEAFYGLGQHQNGIMNYRGHDVDLWQHNIVASVPFLVSSRNYGILWDNASRTKFGDIRDYQPLSTLMLYDKDGQEGGLTAEYFRDQDFEDVLTTRGESVIAHENLSETGGYPEDFDVNRGSIRWSGAMASEESGVHQFRFYSSHFAKVWFNDKLVVDSWRQNWCPWSHILHLSMEAGQRYPITIEWIPNGGYIGLRCLTPEEEEAKGTMSLWSEVGDQIDYYFIAGDNADEIISGYRTITGQAPMMPKWAMGFWQCRERYQDQEQLLDVVKEFRQRQIPLDNIVQDWFYWPEDRWGDHDFDPERYPDPAGMVKELHDELNAHVMISVWPKFYVGTENYEAFKKQGWLYLRNVEKQERDWVGQGYFSTFYDPYSEGARELFWEHINEKLFSKGFDAWWLDATEPDIHSNLAMEEWRLRIGPTALGSSSRYLNTYSLMNAKGIYEGQRQTNPDQRVFILTRSAYAGQQRYAAATWSGDIVTRWYDLKTQIAAGLNFCLSGIPYWTTDIGGFAVEPRFERDVKPDDLEEWRELNTRWFQFATFCPLFRSHGQFPPREMFNLAPDDHPAYQTMLAYDKLRYRLMPYIYSLVGMVTHHDYTIMRALVMDFGADANVLNIDDQFMFGPALLVNPVCRYQARTREVYLPASTTEWLEARTAEHIIRDSRMVDVGWYDFKTGRYYKGGQTIEAAAPISDIPIFVKAGSIIPFGPPIQYTTEKPADPIRLMVYTGADGEFSLYEDEGVNYNYEKGAFSVIPFVYDDSAKSLTIGTRQGAFSGMLQTRTFEIVWVTSDSSIGSSLDGTPAEVVQYDGSKIVVKRL